MVSEAAARDGYDGVVGIVTHMGDVPVDDQWPPNGCAKCGQPERGHPGGDYACVPPSDALRLARMRARRDARLNPPPSPAPTPEMFATFAADTTKLGESMQRLGEVLARTLNPLVAQMRSIAFAVGAALAEANWPAGGSTCAHVCGPDPGHVCDAKAVTTLRHTLPSGGVRHLPLCGPCAQAETAGPGVAS